MKNFIFVVFAMIVMMGCGTGVNGSDVYDAVTNDIIVEDILIEDVIVDMINDTITSDANVQVDTEIVDNDATDVVITDLPDAVDADLPDAVDDTALSDIQDTDDDLECGDEQVLTADGCCTPNCDERECGDDPICGYSCGACDEGWNCNSSQICECIPQCDNLKCGLGFPDGCGGECGCEAASNGVEKACQGGMCECDKFKSVESANMPEEDKNGNKIYLSCIESEITCIYANGSLVDFNNPTILGQYLLFITFLQSEVSCENNSTQWPDWETYHTYHIVNDNTTCEVAINQI